MTIAQSDDSALRQPLRLWPGVAAVALQFLVRFGAPVVAPDATMYAVLGGVLGGLAVIVWWAFFSRARWSERWGAVVLMIAALVATPRILHESIATGMMGMMFPIYAIPFLSLAFVVWATATRRISGRLRGATMVATIVLACAAWALFRTHGITGAGDAQLAWRWSETPEERLLAETGDAPWALPSVPAVTTPERSLPEEAGSAPAAPPAVPSAAEDTQKERLGSGAGVEPSRLAPLRVAVETEAEWPGFRGPERNGVVRELTIATDWSASPPVELWRRPVGPGWSSFAVSGEFFYTQEQRGDDEVVACYKLSTGEPAWAHRDATRFWESNAGAGPRATPALSSGRIYTFGATGIVNALDARNGAVVWSRNATADTGVEVPDWGFASSPLVVGDLVIIAVAGQLAGYDLATGEPRWFGPAGGGSYSSPHRLTIAGVDQILLLSAAGATSVVPASGALLWKHDWEGDGIVQPATTADGDVLIGSGSGLAATGVRRLAVTYAPGGWTVEERWTSNRLKPYFNDFVVHGGHGFGFDGGILACMDLADGARKWKGGRYGHGQLILLRDQDLLLILSEKGELAVVRADPGQFTELARFPAIEGKTWNHPVLVNNILLVRNSREMAAFRLPIAGG